MARIGPVSDPRARRALVRAGFAAVLVAGMVIASLLQGFSTARFAAGNGAAAAVPRTGGTGHESSARAPAAARSHSAHISASTAAPAIGAGVRFRLSVAGGTPDVVRWTFGDGTSRRTHGSASVVHSWAADGTYGVRAQVTFTDGTPSPSNTVTVRVGAPAVVIEGSTLRPEVATEAQFRLRASSGTVTSVTWSFGDGSTIAGQAATHRWAALGTFPVGAQATFADGSHASAEPVAVTVQPHTVTVRCQRIRFEVGEPVSCGLGVSAGEIRAIAVDWGDGQVYDSTTHHWDRPGTYQVTGQVVFVDGTMASSAPVTVTVTPLTVTITASTLEPAVGADVQFRVHLSTGTINTVAWDFGDGTGSGTSTAHRWTAAGTYLVIAHVRLANASGDQMDGTRVEATPVTVTVQPPSA